VLGSIGRRGSRRPGGIGFFLVGSFFAGAALGIGATLLFDPAAGPRRRGLIRDKLVHYGKVIERRGRGIGRNAQERAKGRVMEAIAARRKGAVDDGTLVQRVRAAIGRHVRHVHPIVVQAEQGVVKLSGPILASEVLDLIAAVRAVRGVREVENALDVHIIADIPALRGDLQRASS